MMWSEFGGEVTDLANVVEDGVEVNEESDSFRSQKTEIQGIVICLHMCKVSVAVTWEEISKVWEEQ